LPLFIQRKKGHIINIGSTAGKEVYKDGNGYCATKHAVDAISKAMRIDLLPHQIKVTAIHPGAADTEFSLVRYKGDEDKAAKV
ncbi:SDR family NAD(P)-dependent oxidoreductase, partial [Acinetobacter baumannii]